MTHWQDKENAAPSVGKMESASQAGQKDAVSQAGQKDAVSQAGQKDGISQTGRDADRRTAWIASRGLLIALALVLSWVESRIPVFFAVPGMKLGLTNLVVLIALYRLGYSDALLLNLVRILLVGLSFGNLFSMAYSLAGGALSFLVMFLLKKSGRFHIITVSTAGGVFHNVGQVIVAMLVLGSGYVAYYLPVLWISGIAAGAVIGLISGQIVRRLPRFCDHAGRTEKGQG